MFNNMDAYPLSINATIDESRFGEYLGLSIEPYLQILNLKMVSGVSVVTGVAVSECCSSSSLPLVFLRDRLYSLGQLPVMTSRRLPSWWLSIPYSLYAVALCAGRDSQREAQPRL